MIEEPALPPFNFQPRRPIRYRKAAPTPPSPAPPAAVNVTGVGADHGVEFDWYLVWSFDAPLPPSLTPADVHGLTAGNVPPAAIVDRGDDWLMLRCHCEEGVGATWLVAPGGSPVFVPGQTGTVQEI